jgi:hypothetical protein
MFQALDDKFKQVRAGISLNREQQLAALVIVEHAWDFINAIDKEQERTAHRNLLRLLPTFKAMIQ